MKKIFFIGFMLGGLSAHAQPVLTQEEAIEAALKNSPALQSAGLAVRRQEQLLGAARNIPNLDITFDSPTGIFYTAGVRQAFRFPTVYGRQYQQQQQQVVLSQQERNIVVNDLKYRVYGAYLAIRAAEAYRRQLLAQDSVYARISQAAQRNFDAGTIDKLALIYAETQAAEVKNQVRVATAQLIAEKKQLEILTGLSLSSFSFPVLTKRLASPQDTLTTLQHPSILAAQQWEAVTQKAIEVEKANALPGFMVGYYNQGTRESSLGLRWQAGISIPIWAGQYKSRINAAQTERQIARQTTEAQKQMITSDRERARGELMAAENSVTFYETVALQQADAIINTARRFFESGQTDYINFLRTTNDAYQIRLRYVEALRSYNQSILTINYLTGTL